MGCAATGIWLIGADKNTILGSKIHRAELVLFTGVSARISQMKAHPVGTVVSAEIPATKFTSRANETQFTREGKQITYRESGQN